jgi:hypothetical protein
VAAAASVHHQQVDSVAAHVEDTQSHTLNLTAAGVNFVRRPRCGAAAEDSQVAAPITIIEKLLGDDRGNLAFGRVGHYRGTT